MTPVKITELERLLADVRIRGGDINVQCGSQQIAGIAIRRGADGTTYASIVSKPVQPPGGARERTA
jgi:hypothetical protein